jgi:hypothetical protein
MNYRNWLICILLSVFILIGFRFRLIFIYNYIFHPDEFLSLLAISRIIELGIPLLPSGQIYDTGLLYSYVAALFAAIFGLDEGLVPWASLWFSLLMIPLSYHTIRQVFLSRSAGLLAALTMGLYSESILWSGRVRMYSMAQFLYLLALLFIWTGFLSSNRARRLTGYAFLLLGLFTHFVLILVIPPLALALLAIALSQWRVNVVAAKGSNPGCSTTGVAAWAMLRQRKLIGELILVVVLVLGVVLIQQFSFDAGIAATGRLEAVDQPVDLFGVMGSVVDLSAFWSGLGSIWHYLSTPPEEPLAILAGISLLTLGWRYMAGKWRASDSAALFVALTTLFLVLEIVTLLDGRWRHGRYYFIVLFPLLMMLASYAVKELLGLTECLIGRLNERQRQHSRRFLKPLVASLLSLWLITTFYKVTYADLTESFKTYRYDLAWRYVAQKRQPSDTTMSSWPAAAYLYTQQIDYYVNQTGPVVMPGATGEELVDKYASAILVRNFDQLNELLAQPGRTWLVIEDARLFNFLEPDFVEQIYQQMRLIQSFGNIYVFVEKEALHPLPEQPTKAAQVNLSQQMIFKGYSLQPDPPVLGEPIFLTLFWQPLNPSFNYKIFVHLRNSQEDIVTQADFVPLEGTSTDLRGWVRKTQAHTLRTANLLDLPAVLPAGGYTLWIGLYEPYSLQRVPVTQDTSGENAIKLLDFQISPDHSIRVVE